MIELIVDLFLYMSKITNHSSFIKILGFAVYGNNPIMAVYVTALAFIGKLKVMSSCYLHPLRYVIHL